MELSRKQSQVGVFGAAMLVLAGCSSSHSFQMKKEPLGNEEAAVQVKYGGNMFWVPKYKGQPRGRAMRKTEAL